ncbi:MAG: LptF/LptG family permease [Verrucomicrobiota bacterium]
MFTKIFFRYLFGRLFMPFAVTISACTMIWVMVDLYGNLDDFLEHGINLLVILRFYSLQIPNMLVQVLPAALLFSTMWTLLSLNRRSELVAFQAGGMAPAWLFMPFLVFAVIWALVLAFDLNWPAPRALVTRDRLLAQVKGENAKNNVFVNLPYKDRVYRRIWFFQSLDINQGTAKGVELLLRDADGNDIKQYFARKGAYTDGGFWRLSDVLEIDYGIHGNVQQQKTYAQIDLQEVTTPPKQLSLIVSQPEQLTVEQLAQYIDTSTSSTENLAKYRTEWWYRILYPVRCWCCSSTGCFRARASTGARPRRAFS